ncbi:MAG: glycosyltransferase family 9 protein [Actinomycetota bacterium]|nr:glycosyltransferase family 9 protein [Actinomycetota bacterium]
MTGANVDWGSIQRILVVRLDNIGDVVMLGPALRAMRANLPEATLTLLCSPAGAEVAPLLPGLDDVLVRRVSWQDAAGSFPLDPARELRLVADLRGGRFDAAIIFTSFSQSPFPPAYACYLAGVPVRVGQSHEFGGSILSHCVPPAPYEAHQVERSLHLIEQVGLRRAGEELEVRVRPEHRTAARRLLTEAGAPPTTPYVVLAPGASCPSRRYEAERFTALVELLTPHSKVIVVGGAKERELAARVAAGAPAATSLAGRTDVATLAGIIEGAELVIANNSAPMHLADALRRPLVALFAGTELESQYAPRSAPSRVLRRQTACAPCHAFLCPYADGTDVVPCLDIPPLEVASAALDLLAAGASAGGGR